MERVERLEKFTGLELMHVAVLLCCDYWTRDLEREIRGARDHE